MLYIDKATILKFDLEMLKKHRRANPVYCRAAVYRRAAVYQFPVRLGDILSTVVGALLICSGIALIVGLFSNRSHNFWPVLSGFLVAVAYLLIGYFFIRAPELGIFAIAAFIAGLFCVAGVIRLMSWYRQRSMKGSWLQLVIGVLDITVIVRIFLGATPMVSVTLVSHWWELNYLAPPACSASPVCSLSSNNYPGLFGS